MNFWANRSENHWACGVGYLQDIHISFMHRAIHTLKMCLKASYCDLNDFSHSFSFRGNFVPVTTSNNHILLQIKAKKKAKHKEQAIE